jgi:putative heme-binding domain-containing protein
VAGDRFETEALGIGADGTAGIDAPNLWDGRLAAWLAATGTGWCGPAGREIVWRSRGTASPALICRLIGDPATFTSEALALVRALDFQDRRLAREAILPLVTGLAADDEKRRIVLPELVVALDPADAADPVIAARIVEAARAAAGSQRFLDLVRRFGLDQLVPDVIALASAEDAPEQLAAAAAGIAVERAAADVARAAAAGDAPAARLLAAVGMQGSPPCLDLLAGMLAGAAAPDARPAAIRGLARSRQGCERLVALAKEGGLAGPAAQAAAVAIAACPWSDLRQAAAGVLPLPPARGGGAFPPVAELVTRSGAADRGRQVFAGAGTCGTCHVVDGAGRNVGPDLSGVGAKLSREALYEAILAPSAAISHSYETWTALLEDGRSATGLLISKSPDAVVIRGPDGIDRPLPAAEIDELVRQPVSIMPGDLATLLSADDLVDLVSWLETLKKMN